MRVGKSEGGRRPATFSAFLIHPSTKVDKSKRVSNNGNKRIGASSFNTTMLRRLKPSIPDSCNRERRGAVIEGSGKRRPSSVADAPSNRGTHFQVRLFMVADSRGRWKATSSPREANVPIGSGRQLWETASGPSLISPPERYTPSSPLPPLPPTDRR